MRDWWEISLLLTDPSSDVLWWEISHPFSIILRWWLMIGIGSSMSLYSVIELATEPNQLWQLIQNSLQPNISDRSQF